MTSPLARRLRLGILLLILAAATTATAANRRKPAPRLIQTGDKVRLQDDEFGPTWYVVQRWKCDVLIDNGQEQVYMPLGEIVHDE